MEDRGYVVDLGIKGVKAFIKSLDAEKYVQLHNEGIIHVHVRDVNMYMYMHIKSKCANPQYVSY